MLVLYAYLVADDDGRVANVDGTALRPLTMPFSCRLAKICTYIAIVFAVNRLAEHSWQNLAPVLVPTIGLQCKSNHSFDVGNNSSEKATVTHLLNLLLDPGVGGLRQQ